MILLAIPFHVGAPSLPFEVARRHRLIKLMMWNVSTPRRREAEQKAGGIIKTICRLMKGDRGLSVFNPPTPPHSLG